MRHIFFSVLTVFLTAAFFQPVMALETQGGVALLHNSSVTQPVAASDWVDFTVIKGGICEKTGDCTGHSDHWCSNCGILTSVFPARWRQGRGLKVNLGPAAQPSTRLHKILRPPRKS